MDAKVGDWRRDAAHRQAGRDAGAVAQRAQDRARWHRAATPGGACTRRAGLRGALLESSRPAACTTSSMSITCRALSTLDAAESDLRGRRPAVRDARRRACARCRRGGRSAAADAARPALAGARRCRLTYRATGGPRRARRGLPPGHRLALADRAVRRSLGARARRRRRGEARGPPALLWRRCSQHLDEAGLGHVSEIADGDARRTPRAAARFRPGRSAKRCASIGWYSQRKAVLRGKCWRSAATATSARHRPPLLDAHSALHVRMKGAGIGKVSGLAGGVAPRCSRCDALRIERALVGDGVRIRVIVGPDDDIAALDRQRRRVVCQPLDGRPGARSPRRLPARQQQRDGAEQRDDLPARSPAGAARSSNRRRIMRVALALLLAELALDLLGVLEVALE